MGLVVFHSSLFSLLSLLFSLLSLLSLLFSFSFLFKAHNIHFPFWLKGPQGPTAIELKMYRKFKTARKFYYPEKFYKNSRQCHTMKMKIKMKQVWK